MTSADVLQDISTELEAIRLSLVMGTNELTFNSIIAACVPAMIVDLASQLIIVATSQVTTLLGYDENALNGTHMNMLIPERFREDHDQHVEKFRQSPDMRPAGGADPIIFTALRKDGTEVSGYTGLYPRMIGKRQCVVVMLLPLKANSDTSSADDNSRTTTDQQDAAAGSQGLQPSSGQEGRGSAL